MAAPEVQITIPDEIARHPAWARLEDQLSWYDRKSLFHQRMYKWTKVIQMTLAASIPLIAFMQSPCAKWLTAGAGASIVVLEGIQQLWQHSSLWISYRATAEFLKHEKHLFLAGAGPYRDRSQAEQLLLLAERVEERVSTEHANWVSESEKNIKQTKGKPTNS